MRWLATTLFVLGMLAPTTPASAGAMPVACAPSASSTWGTGQICWQGDTWWVTIKDIKTDGLCVSAVRTDNGDRIARNCSSSPVTSGAQQGTRGARVVRDDGRYFTLPKS